MGLHGPNAKRVEKKKLHKPPCERDCEHFVNFPNLQKPTKVLCKCTRKCLVRSTPARSGYVSCPDHPNYERKGLNVLWFIAAS